MKWFKLFSIRYKNALFHSIFEFFLLRSAAMRSAKNASIDQKTTIFRQNQKSLNHFNLFS